MKIGFIFSGQGAQYQGMGQDLYETFPIFAQTIDEASQALGWDMKELCFGQTSNLDETEFTQPAVLTMSVALDRLLRSFGVKPEVVAGLSLGEYSALVASGALDFKETVQLVQKRGRWMTQAVPSGQGAMSAIMNVERQKLLSLCQEASQVGVVMPANYNTPSQIVISGETAAVTQVEELVSQLDRSKAIRLNVSGPFHSALLGPASIKLAEALPLLTLQEMKVPVVTNVTGQVILTKDAIVPTLVEQVKSPVYWEECVETMIALGVDTFIELGPGKALKSFVKKINRDVFVENVENTKTLEKVLEKLKVKLEENTLEK